VATLVWGHGTRDRGEEKTFVPEGTTVKWYSDVDQNLFTRNGYIAASSGDFGSPNDEQGPGRGTEVEVINYGVSADREKWDFVAILNNNVHDLYFVGGDVKEGHLCNDVAGCQTAGTHQCDGVFGTVKPTSELVILVCRGIAGIQNPATAAFGSDAKDPLAEINKDTTAFIDRFIARVKADPAAAEQEFEGLSNPVKIIMTTSMSVPGWQAIRWAADAGNNGDIPSLFTQLKDQLNNTWAEQFLTIPRYLDGLEAGAKSNPELFFRTLAANPGSLTTKIGELAPIAAVKQELDQKRAAFENDTWSPDDAALAAVTKRNGDNVKATADGGSAPIIAGGVLALIGDGHDPRVDAYVRRQSDLEQGSITVTKGGAFSKGAITVKGIAAKETLVKTLVEEISDKKLTFS
jgi:hypothetical protein